MGHISWYPYEWYLMNPPTTICLDNQRVPHVGEISAGHLPNLLFKCWAWSLRRCVVISCEERLLFLELQLEGLGHVELAEPSLIGKPLGESSIKWMSQTFKMSIQHHLVHRTQIKIVDILSIDSTCPSASTQIEKKLCNQFFLVEKNWSHENLTIWVNALNLPETIEKK